MPVLFDTRLEKFCQYVAGGMLPKEARIHAGWPKTWSINKKMADPVVAARLTELQQTAAAKVAISRADILDGILQEWKLARAAAQHSAALKAAELYGSEMYGMFRKQVEVGKPGDFDNMSEDQLKQHILTQLQELGISPEQLAADKAKLIEATPSDATADDV